MNDTLIDPLETSIDNNNNNNTSSTSTTNSGNSVYRRGVANASASASSSSSLFVSRHRKVLDRIAVDSTESRRYTVPSPPPPTPPLPSLSSTTVHGNRNSSNSISGSHGNNGSASGISASGGGGSAERVTAAVVYSCCAKIFLCIRKTVTTTKTCDDWASYLLPMYKWLKVYEWKTTFGKDLVAGMTVGIMIIPQSMSYAKLAGLPVEYGLYSALVPVYAYALFGSSRQLAVGPVAIISLLLSTGLINLLSSHGITKDDSSSYGDAEKYQALYNQLAIQTSFLVGVTNIIMGLLRMGFVTIFLSHAVISGFTTGAAVIIGMSQVKYIVGYEVERSDQLHEIIGNLIANIEQFNWKTFLMGTCSIALLMLMKHLGKKYKHLSILRAIGPLTVTVLSIILTVTLHLDEKGIPIIAYIPKGFPAFTGSEWFPIHYAAELAMIVLSIVIVGFMESIAIAKTLASKHKYEIDASMELIGLGMSNFMGSMFQSYPVTGSFSRSAVNNDSGAQSGIAGMITATLVGFTLLLLTPVFEKLPLNVLAAIVISGVLGLLDYDEAIYLWKVHKFDCSVWMTACLGTMFLGVEIGLAIAVGVSLLIVIYESAYPHTSVLGRLPGTNIYRNVKQYPQGERYDGIVIVRIDASLYFANAQNVRDAIRKYRLQAQEELDQTTTTSTATNGRSSTVRYIILDLAPVGSIDTSALHILTDMYETYLSREQQLCFSNPNPKVMERMILSGFTDKVGRRHFFCSLQDAVHYCLDEMDAESVDANALSFQDEMEAQQQQQQPLVVGGHY